MKIYLMCFNMESEKEIFEEAAKEQNVLLTVMSYKDFVNKEQRMQVFADMVKDAKEERTAILYSSYGMNQELEECFCDLPKEAYLIPIGSEAIAINPGNIDGDDLETMNRYYIYGGRDNYYNSIRYIVKKILTLSTKKHMGTTHVVDHVVLPLKKPFDGIYSLENTDIVYHTLQEFINHEQQGYKYYVGILSHRSSYMKEELAIEREIAKQLNQIGVGAIPVFSNGESGDSYGSKGFKEIIESYFCLQNTLKIEALVNFQLFLIHAKDGKSQYEQSVYEFKNLGIPIFHPIDSYHLTYEKWKELINPLAIGLQSSLLNPEMTGMIEPILVGVKDCLGKSNPISERIHFFANRVKRYIVLRHKRNEDKKVAIFLHNSVCASVEATIGKAFGLNAMQSIVELMNRMKNEGFTVTNIPKDGKALKELIFEKKAFSDFRWTSVEDIVEHGGCLYQMDCEREYSKIFMELPDELRAQMIHAWGEAPGEGMVYEGRIVITGIQFGNVTVLVQPKRGCYGAKCTGEVCRILHDPLCPPTHQYFATYRYLEQIAQVDALIHMGTDGSLEYLPGKSNALSSTCWPLTVLGTLPNIYPYHAGVVSEGMIAKRRANALTIGYIPPSSSGATSKMNELLALLDRYLEAVNLENGQAEDLKIVLQETINQDTVAKRLMEEKETFIEGVTLVKSHLLSQRNDRRVERKHILGINPDNEEQIAYITEVFVGEGLIDRLEDEDIGAYDARIRKYVEAGIDGTIHDSLIDELLERLSLCSNEMDAVLNALNGGYIPSGETGMPDDNGIKILPTGRNLYSMNMEKIPTQVAYNRGIQLADQLIEAYQKDEGHLPEKIAMNMISLDISRTHGEQLSQFLYLLGVKPEWDNFQRVQGLKVIPIHELGRPRIDISVRISGVMRDSWPEAVELLDEAVLLVSELEESDEDNFIRKNMHKMQYEDCSMSKRSTQIRIFGDPPGTYGAGIDLALKASAWKKEEDLARYFVQSSCYAYGKDLQGKKSVKEFISNAKQIDLTCDVTPSRRMDTLACGFGLQVHGGYRLVAKLCGNKNINQYQSVNERNDSIKTGTLKETVENDIRATLLNAYWIDAMKKQEYDGASKMMHRIQNMFDAQCTSNCIEQSVLDAIANQYVNNEDMREWLLSNNRYAGEEIARRLLELNSRNLWKPNEELLDELRMNYLQFEGDLESGLEGNGSIQGGSVDIINDEEVDIWKEKMKDIDEIMKQYLSKE